MTIHVQESKLHVSGGVELFVAKHRVDQPQGVIIIVHGLCEHSGRYLDVAKRLNEFGYTVYRFDNRGHGRSGGDRGYVADFNELIDDAEEVVALAKKDHPGLPVFMLGHSMGGFIAASHAVKYPGRLSGQVLSGAATAIQPMLAGLEGMDFSAKAREPIANALVDMVSRDPLVVSAYKDDPLNLKEFSTQLMSEVLIRGARWLMNHYGAYTCPCLILHGGADQIVTPNTSKAFYVNIASADKELKIYDGLFHEILNEPEKDVVLEDIRRWLEKRQ